MREATFTLNKFAKGLRVDSSNPLNSEALLTCYNLKPGALGLEAFAPITDKSGALSVSWPYPQIFIGSNKRYICESTKIYEMDSAWAQTLKVTTTASGIWDFIDLDTYIIFVNGAKIVTRDPVAGTYSADNSFTTMPRFATGCLFKGQLIAGNIKTTWHGCGVNSVIWSVIGSNDFTPGPGNVKGAVNEAGFFTSMYWEGEVYRVKRIGNAVMVYGDNGIAALHPYDNVYGLREHKYFGIASKGAVDGDYNEHLIVDPQGTLWKVSLKFSAQGGTYEVIEELGYREFISTLDLTEVMVSYDKGNDEYYISDDQNCYLLTKQGLCKVYQRITSVVHLDGVTYGISSDGSDTGAEIKLDTVDFGTRGIKTVMGVECGVYHPAGSSYKGYAGVDYRYNKTADFTSGSWKLMNPSGVVTVPTGGEEFRIKCKFDNYIGVRLDYIAIDVKMTDRRFMRGPVAGSLTQVTE